MEWQGIDLSFSQQKKWLITTKYNLIKVISSIIIALLCSSILFVYNQAGKEIYQLSLIEYKKYKQQVDRLDEKINELKQNNKIEQVKLISNQALQSFLNYIQQFGVSGVIENIHFYYESEILCKLTGKLHSQSEFQQIEQQLKQLNLDYRVERYQTNEKYQVEFSVLIRLGE